MRRSTLAALVAVYLAWGSTFLAIRVAVAELPPLLMSGVRHGLAGLVLLVVARLRGARLPSAAEWGRSLVLGGLLLALGNGSLAYAEQRVSSSLAAMVFAAVPLLAALISGLLGRWPRRGDWAGLVVGAGGVALLCREAAGHGDGALVWLLVAALATAVGAVLRPRLSLPAGAMGVAAQLLCGGAVLVVVAAARGERLPAAPAAGAWLALAYLVVVGSIIGYSAYLHVLATTPPAVATSNNLVNPVVAAVLGALVLHERLPATSLAGMALVLGGVVLLLRPSALIPSPRIDAAEPLRLLSRP
jgi:drug/metabolite transporter (DMT)-like permease